MPATQKKQVERIRQAKARAATVFGNQRIRETRIDNLLPEMQGRTAGVDRRTTAGVEIPVNSRSSAS